MRRMKALGLVPVLELILMLGAMTACWGRFGPRTRTDGRYPGHHRRRRSQCQTHGDFDAGPDGNPGSNRASDTEHRRNGGGRHSGISADRHSGAHAHSHAGTHGDTPTDALERAITAHETRRNAACVPINWRFSTDHARTKLHRFYPCPSKAD